MAANGVTVSMNAPAEVVKDSAFGTRLTGPNAKSTYYSRAKGVGEGSAVYGGGMTFSAAAPSGRIPTWAWVVILIVLRPLS